MNSHQRHSPAKRHQQLIPPRTGALGSSSILKTRIAKKSTSTNSAQLLRKQQQQLQAAGASGSKLPWGGKTPNQVHRRNERERRRVEAVNRGYEHLAEMLIDWEELKHKKLTKAQTLKAAILYIEHLQRLLKVDSGSAAVGSATVDTNYTDPPPSTFTDNASNPTSSHSCSPDSANQLQAITNAYEIASDVKYASTVSSCDSAHHPHYFSSSQAYCTNGPYEAAQPAVVAADSAFEPSYRTTRSYQQEQEMPYTNERHCHSSLYINNRYPDHSYTMCGPNVFLSHAYKP